MRMRKKPNLEPRLEKCSDYIIKDLFDHSGKWLEDYPGYKKLFVELGCGKGRFTLGTALDNPDTLLIAVEKVPDAMVVAAERARDGEAYNARFIDADVVNLGQMFEKGEIDRIYINFCDPWPKSRDAKYRLTAPSFLRLYADALKEGGEIHFKTDNLPLFTWSVEQFKSEGWELYDITNDLHGNGICGIMTDYEAKFHEQGIKINRLSAKKTAGTKTTAAGPAERLKNASLTDARGYEESRRSHLNEAE